MTKINLDETIEVYGMIPQEGMTGSCEISKADLLREALPLLKEIETELIREQKLDQNVYTANFFEYLEQLLKKKDVK